MTANPVDLITGLTTTSPVVKGDITSWAKARVPQVLANATEIRNTSLAGQVAVELQATGMTYYLDAADTTTADDGVTCIISFDGKRFKLQPGTFVLDTDGTLAANSDLRVPSQKAVKTYADGHTATSLQASNNLSDVANAATARTNIGAASANSTRTRAIKTAGSGTYTTPTGCKAIVVRMVGGGGGGAATGTGAGTASAGGNTTFGTMTANGGAGGSATGAPAAGGTASGGDINVAGTPGYLAGQINSAATGVGGASVFGGAGVPNYNTVGGNAATNSGSGGGGGHYSGTGGSATGGGSGAYCEKLITTPAATYSYAVGAAGIHASAGTGGAAGGDGAAGIIIIDEFY
ncbi:hypothetical protein ACVWXO_008123 [Bradyrhizobium sp. LM2.7]